MKGKTYNPIRGKKGIEYARTILINMFHLKITSWKNIAELIPNDKE